MTREEAIERIKSYKRYLMGGNPIWSVEEVAKAFDMAIEALKAEPTGDLISRQEAVEEILRNKDAKPLNESDYQDGIRAGLDIAYCVIRDLPLAEPVHGEWVTAGHTNGLTGTLWAACSICGSPGDLFDKYCRVCGAKMDGGNHE